MTALRVLVGGDVFPNLPDGEQAFRHLRQVTSDAGIVVGNCEGVYSDDPAPAPSHKSFMVAPRQRGSMLGEVPFHLMSLANNHMLDGGYRGLAATKELLESQGIATVGAGSSLSDALKATVVERDRQRIAFLGFCSVFPVGYEARPNRPGIAPLRVRTFYADPDPNFWEPGIAPVMVTAPLPEDLRGFREAIAAARDDADAVVVLCHWGYSKWTEVLQDYELELARDAVHHGADVVVCAHHHSLRGVELHHDKPIFFGMGTLVHHLHPLKPVDPAFPYFPFTRDARMSGFASVEFDGGEVVGVGLVPAMIRSDGSTELLRPGSEELDAYVEYMRRINVRVGFDTTFRPAERSGWAYLAVEDRR